jgi:tripartite-type tricarboxylate transporter receptor subunit TctC
MKRLLVLAGLIACVASTLQPAASARAQDYPTRQITLIAPWPAGGAVDALCRAVAQPLAERLGKSVVVENRPGAGSVIGTAAGAKASADGYTLVMAGSGSLAISATMYKKLPYDSVKDFEHMVLGARIPFVLVVNPSLPVRTVTELVKYAKDHPGQLSFGSGGPGSPHHLYGELLKSMTGIEMTHIPYKGSAPALTDVIAGHVPLMFSDTVPSLPQIKEGRARARRLDRDPPAVRARHPADCGSRRPWLRCRWLGRVLGAGRHAEGGRGQAANGPRQRHGVARRAAADHQARHDPGRRRLARGAQALHRFRDRALGQGRDPGGFGGDGVRLAVTNRHKNRVGHINVRHMCDDGVLSKPKPSFGCLKLRPMISTKSSRLTLALGSKE